MLDRRNLLTGLGMAMLGSSVAWAKPRLKSHTVIHGPRAAWFPNVTLYTHEGKAVKFYDDLIAGKVVAVNVMYTTCEGMCPLSTLHLKRVQELIGGRLGKDTFMYSLTLEPERDRPGVLRDYMRQHDLGPGWTFLTGSRADITAVRYRLGFYDIEPAVDGDNSTHTGMVRIGNEKLDRWCMEPVVAPPEQIARTILRMHFEPRAGTSAERRTT